MHSYVYGSLAERIAGHSALDHIITLVSVVEKPVSRKDSSETSAFLSRVSILTRDILF